MAKATLVADDIHLGWRPLDFEHQGQIELLLAVEAELRGTADKARLAMMLDQLIEFTNIHFMSEQVLMRELAYPGLRAHEAEHDHLMDQMRDFQKRTNQANAPSPSPTFPPCATGSSTISTPRTPSSPSSSPTTPSPNVRGALIMRSGPSRGMQETKVEAASLMQPAGDTVSPRFIQGSERPWRLFAWSFCRSRCACVRDRSGTSNSARPHLPPARPGVGRPISVRSSTGRISPLALGWNRLPSCKSRPGLFSSQRLRSIELARFGRIMTTCSNSNSTFSQPPVFR